MPESVYKVIELVGTSTDSWERAAAAAVKRAAKTLRDLRVAEISQLDMQLKDGKVESYRAKVKVSFKYEGDCSSGKTASSGSSRSSSSARRRCSWRSAWAPYSCCTRTWPPERSSG